MLFNNQNNVKQQLGWNCYESLAGGTLKFWAIRGQPLNWQHQYNNELPNQEQKKIQKNFPDSILSIQLSITL